MLIYFCGLRGGGNLVHLGARPRICRRISGGSLNTFLLISFDFVFLLILQNLFPIGIRPISELNEE